MLPIQFLDQFVGLHRVGDALFEVTFESVVTSYLSVESGEERVLRSLQVLLNFN